MFYELSHKVTDLRGKFLLFMNEHIYPNEAVYEKQLNEASTRWTIPPIIEELKEKAKAQGLWNLFSPSEEHGPDQVHLRDIAKLEIREQLNRQVFVKS